MSGTEFGDGLCSQQRTAIIDSDNPALLGYRLAIASSTSRIVLTWISLLPVL